MARAVAPIKGTPGGVNALSAQVSVSAVATVTTVIAYSIPANSLAPGTSYRISSTGSVDNAAASPTFSWALRFAGTTLATVLVPSITAASAGKAWRVEAMFSCRLGGATSKVVGSIEVTNEIATTFTAAVNIDSPLVNAGAFNATLAQTLELTMNMGTAAAGNIMRAEIGVIELLRL